MKKKLPTILISIIFIMGLFIMLYPSFSNWYNERVSSYVVSNYNDILQNTSDEEYEQMMLDAKEYNHHLHSLPKSFISGAPESVDYLSNLNLLNGMMGYIVIDELGINLPIYHGTDESILQEGVGHLEGSSLPTGEIGNNTVLTGHTGLPSAKLFTDLVELEVGDTFKLVILNQVFVYEVFDTVVVEPHEVDELEAISNKDTVTLITCTPYGVNSHRLLVQGEQVDTYEKTEDDLIVDNVLDTPIKGFDDVIEKAKELSVYAIPALILLAIIVLIKIMLKRKRYADANFMN